MRTDFLMEFSSDGKGTRMRTELFPGRQDLEIGRKFSEIGDQEFGFVLSHPFAEDAKRWGTADSVADREST
jgi:hypothetical protein